MTPAAPSRSVSVGKLREWPAVWSADPRVLAAIGDNEVEVAVRAGTARLRYFAAADPAFPAVPLLPATPGDAAPPRDPADPRLPAGTGVRDKVWQRLVVEDAELPPQPPSPPSPATGSWRATPRGSCTWGLPTVARPRPASAQQHGRAPWSWSRASGPASSRGSRVAEWAEMGVPAFAGYDPPGRLRLRFGPEVG